MGKVILKILIDDVEGSPEQILKDAINELQDEFVDQEISGEVLGSEGLDDI